VPWPRWAAKSQRSPHEVEWSEDVALLTKDGPAGVTSRRVQAWLPMPRLVSMSHCLPDREMKVSRLFRRIWRSQHGAALAVSRSQAANR